MPGSSLNTAATLQCPHGGTVQIISANTRVMADGAPLALASDTFVISGCPFQIPAAPSPIPSPCVTVQWTVTDMHNTVNGMPTLSQASVGLCLSAAQVPQGPVVIVNALQKVKTG